MALFQNGEWDVLVEKSLNSSMGRVRRRRNGDSVEKRARQVLHVVQLGELSAGRCQFGTRRQENLRSVEGPNRRPNLPRKCHRRHWHKISSWRTCAVHAVECAWFFWHDHVRPLLEAHGDAAALSRAASLLARNEMLEEVMVAIKREDHCSPEA